MRVAVLQISLSVVLATKIRYGSQLRSTLYPAGYYMVLERTI